MSDTTVGSVVPAFGAGAAPAARAQTFDNVQPITVPPEDGTTGAFALVSDIEIWWAEWGSNPRPPD